MSEYKNFLNDSGMNPYDNKKEGIGSGIAEGLLAVIDPLGVLVQYVGRKMGYDIRTAGGLGFFSGAKTDIENPKGTIGSIGAKTFTAGVGIGAWFNPAAIPYLLAAESIVTVGNIYANVKRYKEKGTLRLEDKL